MEIKKINHNIRCDMGLCKREAVYSIGTKNTMLKRQLNLCEGCAKTLYEELGRLFTPKSPMNIISKKNLSSRSD